MNIKYKVIAYFYRQKNTSREILVFDHQDMPEAGTQVVGGTVEKNEDLKLALVREIKEEAGLEIDPFSLIFLNETIYDRKDRVERNFRTYFKINGSHLPESWSHRVISDGEDNGLIFNFYWISFDDAKKKLTGNFHECLDQLDF